MHWTLVAVVVVALAASALGDDCLPKRGEKHVHARDCCKVTGLFPATMKASKDKCREKYPISRPSGPPPTGPPPTGTPPSPSPEMIKAHVCKKECIFTEEGLLTSEKKLDKAAITKYFTVADTALATAVTTAIESCFKTYAAMVNSTLECKSGAHEFQKCMVRETFLNCPSTLWSATAECEDLKATVTKCPKMRISLGHKPHKM